MSYAKVTAAVDAQEGRFMCSPYVAQVLSYERPERLKDAVVNETWKRYGPGGHHANECRVEPL